MKGRKKRLKTWAGREGLHAAARYGSFLLGVQFMLAGLLSGICCSPDSPLHHPANVDCGTVKTTYEDFGARFFQDYCLRCHSVTRANDLARLDAPMEIDFDTLGMAREFMDRIYLRAGELGDMPPRLMPVAKPTEQERIQLMEWIDCGMLSAAELELNGG